MNKIIIDSDILKNRIAELGNDFKNSEDAVEYETLKSILQQGEEYKGSFDKEGYGVTRVIDDWVDCDCKEFCVGGARQNGKRVNCLNKPIKQEESSNWDDISLKFNHYRSAMGQLEIWDWLKENYNPPTKR